jgi:tetratricopeptide (TPR) repeat protein
MYRRILIAAALTVTSLPARASDACPSDRPVDEIIAQVQKQQSKKAARNKNPMPDVMCIPGWCRQSGKTPPTIPQPAPRAETPSASNVGEVSSSKPSVNKCDEAMEKTLEAARDVEVGDFYFADKNFRPAASRYEGAVQNKPEDAAIHVRLGRVYEKLREPAQALEHYAAAAKLSGPEKWIEEARSAMSRLQR